MTVLICLLMTLQDCARSRAVLQLEVLALQYQLRVLERSRSHRLRLTRLDRLLWVWLSQAWGQWRTALRIVKPETVIVWHRRGFRLFWSWKSRHKTGRPSVSVEVRSLIRTMSTANPLRGAPRIHGELLKLGFTVSQTTVATYMVRRRPLPSQTWRTFLTNHARQLIAADFFVVPTATQATVRLGAPRRRPPPDRSRRGHGPSHGRVDRAAVSGRVPWDELPRYPRSGSCVQSRTYRRYSGSPDGACLPLAEFTNTNAPGPEQGCTHFTSYRAAERWIRDRHSAGRQLAPPLRAARRVVSGRPCCPSPVPAGHMCVN
jgi:hypothetical protein